jgi:hypothetical protein
LLPTLYTPRFVLGEFGKNQSNLSEARAMCISDMLVCTCFITHHWCLHNISCYKQQLSIDLSYYTQADFVHKHDHGFGLIIVGEQDGSDYYHLNFHARDKKGHSQFFFGEIMVCVSPEEEDVTCCHPVSLYVVCDLIGSCAFIRWIDIHG